MSTPSGNPFPIENSDYYKLHLLEVEEIKKHKWCLSETAGKDVGWSYAQYNWIMAGHRQRWLDGIRGST